MDQRDSTLEVKHLFKDNKFIRFFDNNLTDINENMLKGLHLIYVLILLYLYIAPGFLINNNLIRFNESLKQKYNNIVQLKNFNGNFLQYIDIINKSWTQLFIKNIPLNYIFVASTYIYIHCKMSDDDINTLEYSILISLRQNSQKNVLKHLADMKKNPSYHVYLDYAHFPYYIPIDDASDEIDNTILNQDPSVNILIGGNDIWYAKYIKYKTKYLILKKQLP